MIEGSGYGIWGFGVRDWGFDGHKVPLAILALPKDEREWSVGAEVWGSQAGVRVGGCRPWAQDSGLGVGRLRGST